MSQHMNFKTDPCIVSLSKIGYHSHHLNICNTIIRKLLSNGIGPESSFYLLILDQFSTRSEVKDTLWESGATSPDQSGPGSDGNKGVLHIPQSSSITGTSPSDCLVSLPGHLLGGSYPSAEVQLVYSTAPADWASLFWITTIS